MSKPEPGFNEKIIISKPEPGFSEKLVCLNLKIIILNLDQDSMKNNNFRNLVYVSVVCYNNGKD